MRIVHVVDYFHPPLGYQDAGLAHAEARQGHEVHVLTSDRYRPFDDYDAAVGPLLGPRHLQAGVVLDRDVRIHRLRTRVEARYRVWLDGLEACLTELDPDFILVHSIGGFNGIRVARWKLTYGTRTRLAFDEHMVPPVSTAAPGRLFYAVFRALAAPMVWRAADALVAVSEATREFMLDAYGFSAQDVTVIPLGADTTLFVPNPALRAALRRKLELTLDDIVFIYAGKLIPSKAPHLLVEATLKVIPSLPNVKVVMLGNGPDGYLSEMKRLTSSNHCDDHFRWIPAVRNDDLAGYYAMADVGVWPARSSLSMLEAQACELPIVVSTFPAAAERVAFGNGVTFSEGDAHDLACRMLELGQRPAERRAMGERGRRMVEREWNYERLSDRFLAATGANVDQLLASTDK